MGIAEIIELEKEKLIKQHQLELAKLQEELDNLNLGSVEFLCKLTEIKTFSTIRKRILFPFRKELEGEIVDFPPTEKGKWYVNKPKFEAWYADNFGRIDRRNVNG